MLAKLKKLSILPIILSLTFISTSYGKDLNNPPIEIPFSTQNVGQTYNFDVNIKQQQTYGINLNFYLKLPNRWSHFLDKESPEDARRISDILGSPKLVNHQWVEPGVPAKFRVQIIQRPANKVVLDQLINTPPTNAAYMGRHAILAEQELPKGTYNIRISYLEGSAALAPLQAKIIFSKAYHGK